MASLNYLEICSFLEKHREYLQGYGFRIEASTNAHEMREFALSIKGKETISRPFDFNWVDLIDGNFLALLGYDGDGAPAHVQCWALDHLGETTLASWFKQRYGRILQHEVGECHPPVSKRIRGQVVYAGELYTRKDLRHSGLSAVFVRLGMAVVYLHFDKLDWLYGFTSGANIYRGFGGRQLWHADPHAVDWGGNSVPEFDQGDWLIWLSREDLEWRFSQKPEMYF